MAQVPAGLPGTVTDAPDGNASEAKAATQVLAVTVASVATKSKRVDCLLFSWMRRENSLVGLVAAGHHGAVVALIMDT